MQDLVHYPPLPPTTTPPGPINTHFPSNMFNFSSFDQSLNDPPLPPHPQHQRKLEKGDSSTRPHPPPLRLIRDNTPIISKAFPSCISTQDESSKDDSEDYEDHHQQQQPPLTSREAHNVCQKRRRDRVKEKINTLKDLIPNCDKNDMASVLDEAIKYIKSLKLQAQYYGWYQQQVHARPWGGGQIPVVSPVASSILRAPPYLQYDLHQQQMILPYHPMILMQPPSHEQLTRSLPPIPKKSATSSTSTSAAEIDNREVEKSLP